MDLREACGQYRLPPEVWIEIFLELNARYLRRVRLVCRRWRDIVDGTSPLLARLRVFFAKQFIDSEFQPVHLLPAKKAWFKSVTITGIGSWWPPFGQGLTEIAIYSDSRIETSVLIEMLQNAPNLRCLMLGSMSLTGESCTHDDLNMTKLQRLEIEEFTPVKVLQVFRGLRACNLKFLSVPFSCPDNDSSLEIASFVGHFKDTLQELDITCTDAILREMTKLDRLHLKKLTAKENLHGNSATLIEFLRVQPSLEFLDTRDTLVLAGSNQEQLNAMGRLLPKLKSFACFLAMWDVDEVVDLTFLSSIPNLQTLSITGADEEFFFIDCALPKLRELDISHTFFAQGRLPRWLASMPHLCTLTIECCEFVGCWLDLLGALASLKQLRCLTLEAIHASTVTDRDCLFDLGHLEYLHLKYMAMSHEELFAIFGQCSGLRVLSFERMHLSEQLLNIVCWNVPPVTRLNFERCNIRSFRGTTVDLAKLLDEC